MFYKEILAYIVEKKISWFEEIVNKKLMIAKNRNMLELCSLFNEII